MVTKELILKEMDSMSESTLAEILEFVRSLKGTDKQAEQQTSHTVTVVSSDGEVNIPVEALLNDREELSIPLMQVPMVEPISKVRQELTTALKNSGYASNADIITLVQDEKKEMLVERDSIQ